MIRNTYFFEQIEEYCMEQLNEKSRIEFENELAKNPALRQELKFRMEIRDSLLEKDVLTLREKLQKVTKRNKPLVANKDLFELSDEISNFQETSEVLSSEELINFFDSLPKVHAYHHEIFSKENIHQFYKNQNNPEVNDFEDDLDEFEMDIELKGLEEAILEKDILEFRRTLKQVAKSVEPQYGIEKIDDFINGELTESELIDFEYDYAQNNSLRDEVHFQQELELAIQEEDIMDLRNKILSILSTETSWNVNEKSIEEFIDGVLEGELLEEFRAELNDNTDLMAEIKLRKQINEFLSEKDVFNLRKELKAAKEVADIKKVKMLIPETKIGSVKFWRSSVAIIIVLLGIAGVLGNGLVSVDNIYENYYEKPAWSPERSLSSEETYFQQANMAYLKANYEQVLNIFNQVPTELAENPVFQFYKSASLQNLNRFEEAISGYTKVIENGDNLFIPEAEWHRSLCYVKLGNKIMAKQQLLAVIKRKGFYEDDAKAALRRLRYSLK